MASDRKRDRPTGGTPPTKKQKDKSGGSTISCIVCSKNAEDGSIQCECCFEWVHPKCAGITDEEYGILGGCSPNIMFFCKLCRPQVSLSLKFFNEIKDKQTELDERLQKLESKLAPISGNSNQDTMSQENNSSNANPVQTATTNSHYNLQHDRKFNIVMYGIDECEKGAPRNERSGRDLSSVIETITKVNANVSPLSIRDLHRLGKYQEQSRRPRPILIKFNRAIDVSILLSQTSTLPSGIRIKPDMNPEERQIESLLLKERWSLIQKDINRKVIKIRGNRIFVNNKLHGEVKNRNLVLSQAVLPDDQMESSSN